MFFFSFLGIFSVRDAIFQTAFTFLQGCQEFNLSRFQDMRISNLTCCNLTFDFSWNFQTFVGIKNNSTIFDSKMKPTEKLMENKPEA